MTLLHEAMQEFRCGLWIGAVDFEKAFDSIEHWAIWSSLKAQGVQKQYIDVLRALYNGQEGRMIADQISKAFGIGRGTKQI